MTQTLIALTHSMENKIYIPDHLIWRLYFKAPSTPYRKLYWFEMKQDDLYWGSANKSRGGVSQKIEPTTESDRILIQVPENINELPGSHYKYSYHQNGQFHHRTQFDSGAYLYGSMNRWNLKEDINKPSRIFILLSHVLGENTSRVEKPKINEAKHQYAKTILVSEEDLDKRLYMEFFITPEGFCVHDPPKPALMDGDMPFVFTGSLSSKLILVGRFVLSNAIPDWHPNIDFCFLPGKV